MLYIKTTLLALCVLGSVSMALSNVHGQAKHTMPMDFETRVTASFAELRTNHFHSGLDFGTQGVQNIPVRATADGWVSRVKAQVGGYGYALYVSHYDGTTTVYAHLNSYCTAVDTLLEAEQYRRRSFVCDLYVEPERIKVKRGDVIAYSGNTGSSGGPHLHYEVRDTKSEHALNPLAYLPEIADVVKPQIMGIKTYSLEGEGMHIREVQNRYFGSASAEGKTVDVEAGKVALGLHVTDYFTVGGRPCGVDNVKMTVDGVERYAFTLDHVDFDVQRQINSHLDYREWTVNHRLIQRLYRQPGNKLTYYNGDGVIEIAEGETKAVRLEVRDYAGNLSTLAFTLRGVAKRNRLLEEPNVFVGLTHAIDTANVSVIVPGSALYEDATIKLNIDSTQSGVLYKVGNPSVPLNTAITISVQRDRKFEKHEGLATVNANGKITGWIGGKIENDGNTLTAKSLQMGIFTVTADETKPRVWSRNSRSNLRNGNFVMIGLSDDLSGIARYDVYIDGDWRLFVYDAKQTMLKQKLEKLRIKPGKHTARAVVVDGAGNTETFEWTFTYEK